METTAQHHATITRYLDRLIRRERLLLAVQSAMWAVGAVASVVLLAAIALSVGGQPSMVGPIGLTVGMALVGVAAWMPLRMRWSQSKLRHHQARVVEARLPGLRGRLITVLDRGGDGLPSSGPLLARAARHARRAIEILDPPHIYPARACLRSGAVVGLICVLVAGVGRNLPVGPGDAFAILFGASAASVRLADATVEESKDAAIVGDITLRYLFPAYTGLDSKEVPNSDGTIIAPSGTLVQVTARTARTFDAAAIEIEGEVPIDVALEGGRAVSGSLTVESTSTWRFILFEGDKAIASPWYELRVEADAPPVVVISMTGQLQAPVDAPLGLEWQVTDDYGVVRVAMEIQREDGPEEHIVREPIEPKIELSGVERSTPRDLGLRAGDVVTLRMVAVDNDRASGGNRGESEPLEVIVLGPRGYGRNLTRYHEKLLGLLLDALADFIEESVPPEPTRPGLVKWAYNAPERLDPIRRLAEDQWGSTPSTGVDGMLVSDVLEASSRLFRFTLTTFDRDIGAGGQQPVSADIDTFATLHGETIESLETAAFVIDTMLREVGVMELTKMARRVAESASQVAEASRDTDDLATILSRLDKLERQLGQLRKAAENLSDQALHDFANSTLDQVGGLMAEIRKAIAEGRLEEARAMMDSLAEQLAQFAESLEDRQQRGAEQDDELAERFKALMEDLGELAVQQESLADELAGAQDKYGSGFPERMALWAELDQLADQLETETQSAVQGTRDGRGWRPFTLLRLSELAALGSGIHDSVRGRDVDGAALRVAQVGRDILITERFVMRDLSRSDRPTNGPVVNNHLQASVALAARMASILSQLIDAPGQSSPELEAAAQALSDQQGRLQDWQRELSEEVRTIENAIPTASGKAAESMAGAGLAMERARSFLEDGVALAGEGHQRQASDLVRETQNHLQQSMEDQQQMQQTMRQMQGEKGGSGGKDKSQSVPQDQPEIPAPELFKTPEAYRKALLEGMSGTVPEEFKSLKKRFYEDLVQQ
jgi:hypothetical protein